MFTGLIREIAKVKSFDGKILQLQASYRPKLGDSIAINGVCLSVVALADDGFSVEVADETRRVVAIENFKANVHIEPAMRLQDRLEGHILQGHIDCIGTIIKIQEGVNGKDFYIKIPKDYIKFVVPKGSIAIDGVSLTINEVFEDGFRLTIIPITLQHTLFATYQIHRRVNIETDMFARYLYWIFKHDKSLDWQTIERWQAIF